MNNLSKIIITLSAITLTACGGSGSDSSSSVSGSAMPKAKQLNCSGQECVDTNSVSSFSSAANAYTAVKDRYAGAQQSINVLNSLVDEFSYLAALEGITKCSDLPDSYTMNYEGFGTSNQLILSLGDKSFDLGDGPASMDHKIIRTIDGVADAEFQFKCVSSGEAYMYARMGTDSTFGIEEAYYHYTPTSNTVEYIFKSNTYSDMFRFKEDSMAGSVHFMDVNTFDGVSTTKTGFKNISLAAMPFDIVLEIARTYTNGINLDDFGFGVGASNVRTCVYAPLLYNTLETDPTGASSNCDDNGAIALVPLSNPLVGNNAVKAWDENFLSAITFDLID